VTAWADALGSRDLKEKLETFRPGFGISVIMPIGRPAHFAIANPAGQIDAEDYESAANSIEELNDIDENSNDISP
jgi:hypothetical protein